MMKNVTRTPLHVNSETSLEERIEILEDAILINRRLQAQSAVHLWELNQHLQEHVDQLESELERHGVIVTGSCPEWTSSRR